MKESLQHLIQDCCLFPLNFFTSDWIPPRTQYPLHPPPSSKRKYTIPHPAHPLIAGGLFSPDCHHEVGTPFFCRLPTCDTLLKILGAQCSGSYASTPNQASPEDLMGLPSIKSAQPRK